MLKCLLTKHYIIKNQTLSRQKNAFDTKEQLCWKTCGSIDWMIQ